MLIEHPPLWFRRLFPGGVFCLPSEKEGEKRVFITFDDGPVPEVTPWVLDVLDEFGVKATFFMVGQNVERYPELLCKVKERGHDVGNHTLHHMKGFSCSLDEYIEDVRKGDELIATKFFRPPHGILTRRQMTRLREDYTVVLYDVVTRDYSRRLKPEEVVNNVKRFTRDGSIIVFHDSLKSLPRLEQALPESLRWLKDEGYKFCKLSDVLPV